MEVAVHKGFAVLDTEPHVLTWFRIETSGIRVVEAADVPNPNWLHPGIPSAGQQKFGNDLLAVHDFVMIPSVVSRHSWNVIFDPIRAKTMFHVIEQERFALDPRLNPVTPI